MINLKELSTVEILDWIDELERQPRLDWDERQTLHELKQELKRRL